MNYIFHPYDFNHVEAAVLMMSFPGNDNDNDDADNLADELNLSDTAGQDEPEEGAWDDEDDDDFDDQMESRNDLNEIRVDDDLNEPDPEDDDHLPEEELQ